MRQQAFGTFKMQRYRMEPGDGTRYEFFIAPLESGEMHSCRGADGTSIFPMDMSDVITGVGDGGDDFVTLGILMPSGQGVYEVRKLALRKPAAHYVDYLMGHMPGIKNAYTVAAILLACSVLVDRPLAIEEAAEAMLRTPELLEE